MSGLGDARTPHCATIGGLLVRRKGKFMEKGNVKALLPIGVFLVLYLGLGVLFE